MSTRGTIPGGAVESRLSYDDWINRAKAIFSDSFVDQLEEFNHSSIWRQLQQSRRYLIKDKDGRHLRPDADMSDSVWEIQLGIPGEEIKRIRGSTMNVKKQKYELAVAALQKALDDFRAAEKRAFADDLHGVQRSNNEELKYELSDKQSFANSNDGESVDYRYQTENTNTEESLNTLLEASAETSNIPIIQLDFRNLKTYISPRMSFQKSTAFEKILKCVQGKVKYKIIHVYGMSGSGKSQIVRAVCENMDKNDGNLIIWHVQCEQGVNKLRRKWSELIDAFEKAKLITMSDKSEMQMDEEGPWMDNFISTVERFNIPVLLVVEDVTNEEKDLVRNCIRAIHSDGAHGVQMIIVDQKMDSLYLQDDMKAMDDYKVEKITGFTKEEATKFLADSHQSGKEKMAELATELAYSPLRLLMARSYCEKFRESYKTYYEGLGKDADVISKEKAILAEHPGLSQNHGYEVIMKMLKPKDENKQEQNAFRVKQMMSLLNNSDIPDILLGRLYQEMEEMDVGDERKEVKYLLQELESKCDANIRDDAMTCEYGKQRLSIHMDILHAVRIHMSTKEKAEALIGVLRAMISLVGKENRFRTDSMLLFDMLSHMNRVTELGVSLLEREFGINEPKKENFEIQMGLSRLYEVLGFATTQHSPVTKDDNFEKAIDYLWSIACCYTGISFFRLCFGRKAKSADKNQQVLHYEPGKDPLETAKKVYDKLEKASDKIPVNFVVRNCSRFFPVTPNLLKDMKAKVESSEQIVNTLDWDKMEETLKTKRYLSNEQLIALQASNCLLKPEKLRSIYLTECIASILHSRGRQVLYLKDSITSEEQKRYEWYTELGLQLCRIMFKHTGVKSLFEYILVANNKLPRMLHAREQESNDEFLTRIHMARELAITLRDVKADFYEHGVYKLVSGTPYTVTNALKYIVKANTKIYKRPLVAQKNPIPTAQEECKQLYQNAKEMASDVVVASSCMVHVGKFHAAIEEYDQALDAFESAFDYNGPGINSQLDKNPNIYAWALYNAGRAIYAGCNKINSGEERKKRFMNRYRLLNIPNQWRQNLDETKSRLEAISFGNQDSCGSV